VSVRRSIGVSLAAAAIALTYGASRIPDPGVANRGAATAVSAGAARHLPQTQPIEGDVVATVPMAAFGPADGAPKTLVPGRTYPIDITVVVAATSGPGVVDVVASSGRLVGNARSTVQAGVTRLHYVLVVAHGYAQVTIAVNARTDDGGAVTHAYSHSIG
jgi:hypothetical protein